MTVTGFCFYNNEQVIYSSSDKDVTKMCLIGFEECNIVPDYFLNDFYKLDCIDMENLKNVKEIGNHFLGRTCINLDLTIFKNLGKIGEYTACDSSMCIKVSANNKNIKNIDSSTFSGLGFHGFYYLDIVQDSGVIETIDINYLKYLKVSETTEETFLKQIDILNKIKEKYDDALVKVLLDELISCVYYNYYVNYL